MESEPKPASPSPASAAAARREKGIRIFSYPKIVFLLPTFIVAVICWIGMLMIGDRTADPSRQPPQVVTNSAPGQPATMTTTTTAARHDRFKTPQNLLAVLFVVVLAFNLLVMALDFPRFTIIGILLLVLFGIFFVLWLGAAFDVELMGWARRLMGSIYAYANSTFYFLISLVMGLIAIIVYLTRWLDYWQILPNEILHHHGPLSDLERYPTMNLKFDKEIPDVLEHLFLGSGRLVLHVSDERKAIVLDNVLFINAIERSLKTIMSRMEVRLTTDQEVDDI